MGPGAIVSDPDLISPHFSRSELACPCCGWMGMPPDMIQRLERLREAYGFPLPIVKGGGCRCPAHNAAVSSTGLRGPHTTGLAIDPGGIRGERAHTLLRHALELGATGIGIGHDGSVRHLDWCPIGEGLAIPRPRLWTYPL